MLTPLQEDVFARLMDIVTHTAPEVLATRLRAVVSAYVPKAPIDYAPLRDDEEGVHVDPHANGRQWVEVGEASNTVTYALEVRGRPDPNVVRGDPRSLHGTIVRVVDFDDDDAMSSSMVFLPGVSIDEVCNGA